jgi:hypothetical protein
LQKRAKERDQLLYRMMQRLQEVSSTEHSNNDDPNGVATAEAMTKVDKTTDLEQLARALLAETESPEHPIAQGDRDIDHDHKGGLERKASFTGDFPPCAHCSNNIYSV